MFLVPNWSVIVDEQHCLQNVHSWQALCFLRYTTMQSVDRYVSPHKACSEVVWLSRLGDGISWPSLCTSHLQSGFLQLPWGTEFCYQRSHGFSAGLAFVAGSLQCPCMETNPSKKEIMFWEVCSPVTFIFVDIGPSTVKCVCFSLGRLDMYMELYSIGVIDSSSSSLSLFFL